ncbi:hypothetical protein MKK58_20240 [Methylobacterium sp. J-078]|uniref:hypothetical protein n=1 Tax=Methylobacterium sp. J-078 TaxID=2836657 RepID=UPI001FB98A32|nr:hypothetical protein [Methylobacterium sp. J-078]MCJ2046849.1 hypothetical protein [Methylobacterium sp. J-078]
MSMLDVHCYTSISFSYLSRARLLSETLRKHHPDWVLWLCISDLEPEGFALDTTDHGFDHVLWLKDLPIERLESWIFRHNVVEICTAVKGFFLEKILDSGADIVFYIDPDIALFNDLMPAVQRLSKANIVLTPHLVEPELISRQMWENERSTLLHGTYNLGFLGVQNSVEGRRFAAWWRERLQYYCFETAAEGIYTDQRWCDLVPAFFDGVDIIRDSGFNVASWNLSSRPIFFDKDGRIFAGSALLRFYHFTKIANAGAAMVDRYAGRSSAIYELVKWYRSSLDRYEDTRLKGYWAYGVYSDGTSILHEHRVLYRSRPDLQEDFPNPFRANSFLRWIKDRETAR